MEPFGSASTSISCSVSNGSLPLPHLLQHEGDNFHLDVVEVRTCAAALSPSSTHPGVAQHGCPNERSVSTGQETRATHDVDSLRAHDDAGAARGNKRVQVIGLLGDLDLEVEFCASSSNPFQAAKGDLGNVSAVEFPGGTCTEERDPHLAAPSLLNQECSRSPRARKHDLARSIPRSDVDCGLSTTADVDQARVAPSAEKQTAEEAWIGPTLSLPARATARRSYSTASEPRRKHGKTIARLTSKLVSSFCMRRTEHPSAI